MRQMRSQKLFVNNCAPRLTGAIVYCWQIVVSCYMWENYSSNLSESKRWACQTFSRVYHANSCVRERDALNAWIVRNDFGIRAQTWMWARLIWPGNCDSNSNALDENVVVWCRRMPSDVCSSCPSSACLFRVSTHRANKRSHRVFYTWFQCLCRWEDLSRLWQALS